MCEGAQRQSHAPRRGAGWQKDTELNEAGVKIPGCARGSRVSCPRLTRAGSLEHTQALPGGRKREIGLGMLSLPGIFGSLLPFFFWGGGVKGGWEGNAERGLILGWWGEGMWDHRSCPGDAQGSARDVEIPGVASELPLSQIHPLIIIIPPLLPPLPSASRAQRFPWTNFP